MSEKTAVVSLKKQILSQKTKVAELLPRHMDADRMVRLAVLATYRTPTLRLCEPLTVLNAVMDAARLGLEIGRHAHLVPTKDKQGRYICNLWPDYRGMLDLARRSGDLLWAEARVAYKDEQFDVHYGTNPSVVHVPLANRITPPTDEDVVASYCVAHMANGGIKFEVVWKWELDKVRASSKAKHGPWKDWYEEQAKKTAVKRLCKTVGQSPELAIAIEHDNRMESGEIGHVLEGDSEEVLSAQAALETKQSAEQLRAKLSDAEQDLKARQEDQEAAVADAP